MIFNPGRLSLARRRNGLSKTSLAKQLRVELRAVVGYESGEYVPSDDNLLKLEEVLGFPRSFFFGEDLDEPDAQAASFRALSKMTAAQRDMALSEGAIALHVNRAIEARFELPAPDLPDLSRETDSETAAVALRRYWQLGELSIKNMVHLMEAKGIRVYSLSLDSREVDAFSMWKENIPFMFLNTQKTAEHGRFDVAHELGHLVLHRHAAPQGRSAERDADSFASAFLMPRASVLASAPHFPSLQTLISLKKKWGVSVAALNYRLHALSILSDWQYRTLCIELAQKGFRKAEPDGLPRETSQVLPKVFAALREEGISKGDLARLLDISVKEIDQLIFGLVTTNVVEGTGTAPKRSSSRAHLSLVKG